MLKVDSQKSSSSQVQVVDSILNNIPPKHQSRTLLNTEFESHNRLPPTSTSCDHNLLVNQRWGQPHNRRIVYYQLLKGL
jgi:hypothetical protein